MADENTPNDSISSQSDRDTSQPRQQDRRPLASSPSVPHHPYQPDRQPAGGPSDLRQRHASMPLVVPDQEHSEESEQGQPPQPAAQEQPLRRASFSVCVAAGCQCHLPALQNVLEVMQVILSRQSRFRQNSELLLLRHPRFAEFLISQRRDLVGEVEALRHIVRDLQLLHRPAPSEEHRGGFRERFLGGLRGSVGRWIGKR